MMPRRLLTPKANPNISISDDNQLPTKSHDELEDNSNIGYSQTHSHPNFHLDSTSRTLLWIVEFRSFSSFSFSSSFFQCLINQSLHSRYSRWCHHGF
jgi:hypothetical protein